MLNNQETRRKLRQFIIAVLLPWIVLLIFRVGVISRTGETDPDAFYHAKLAELGPSTFLAKKFPALSLSIWQDHFSDKEMGFHFILWGLHRVGKTLGLKIGCPFHYYNLSFLVLLLAAIALTLIRWNISYPCFYTLFFSVSYYAFTFRLLFLRAYLLAMTLLVLMILLLSIEKLRNSVWRLVLVFLFGWLYSWCYSNPHFILIPTGAFALAEFLDDRDWRRLPLLPLTAILGACVGLCLHPQFPNTWIILKVQCWDVLKMIFGAGSEAKIRGGNEFYVKSWRTLLRAPFLAALPILLFFLLWRLRKHWFQAGWHKNVRFNAMFILFVSTFAAFLLFFRFNEFAMPAIVLFAALLIQGCQEAGKTAGRRFYAYSLLFGLYTIWSLLILTPSMISAKANNHQPYTGIAQWAQRQQIPAGTIIANPRWGAFPILYYVMPQYRYSNGLDPMFAYAYDPEKAIIMEDMRTTRNILPPDKFHELTGADYLYVSPDSTGLASAVLKKGYNSLYNGWDGWIFQVAEDR
jgi:hypothetical protein